MKVAPSVGKLLPGLVAISIGSGFARKVSERMALLKTRKFRRFTGVQSVPGGM
jgi:hypothetical protein